LSEIDKRNRFEEDLFAYQTTKDGKVLISWQQRQVMILKGEKALKLLAQLEGADRRQVQMLLAKVTGNFKRGNER
jgi:hypothetical protein